MIRIYTLGYLWFGRRLKKYFSEDGWLNKHLKKAGILLDPQVYGGTMILVLLVSSIISATISFLLLLIFNLDLKFVLAPLATPLLILAGFIIFPLFKEFDRKDKIDGILPFASGYLSTLAGVGVPPDKLFESLARQDMGEVSKEAKNIVQDMHFLGLDVLTAIKRAVERSPSKLFAEFLEGIRVTLLSGGALRRYLDDQTKRLMKIREEKENEFNKGLNVIGEIYVVLVVLAPLLFIVLLISLGETGGLPLSIPVVLILISYFLIPFASILMIGLIDMTMPKEE